MNLPLTSIIQNSDRTWTFIWASTGAAFYRIVLYGREFQQTSFPKYISKLPGFDKYPPPIEVVAEDDKAISELFPSSITIQWYRVPGASAYQVDELQGGGWTKRQTAKETGKIFVNSYQSYSMDDESEHTFRLRAVDSIGQFSADRQFQISVVTPPKLVETQIKIGYDQATHAIIVTGV